MQPSSSPVNHAQTIRTLYDQALNRRNFGLIDGLFAPQIAMPPTELVLAREQVKANIVGQLTALGDRQYQVIDLIADGDLVAVRTRSIATHTAPVYNAPPTGRRFVEQEITFYRFTDGLVSSIRAFVDPLPAFAFLTAPDPSKVPLGLWTDQGPVPESGFRVAPHQAAAYVRMVLGQLQRRQIGLVDECFSPAFVIHGLVPGQAANRDTMKQNYTGMWAAFSDWSETIEEIVSNGSRVAVVTRTQGTHTGPFGGIAPTGRKIDLWSGTIYELGPGPAPGTFVFTASWGVVPAGMLLAQLGALKTA